MHKILSNTLCVSLVKISLETKKFSELNNNTEPIVPMAAI